ncbi:hypothetical protein D3C73_1160320 [compost metagenome]
MLLEQSETAHHVVEAGAATFVWPIEVMDLARPVEAEADHEVFVGEKGAPLVIEQGAIGLQGIADDLAIGELTLISDRPLKKIQPQQRRLTTLPGEFHFRAVLRRDVTLHIRTQHFVGHTEALAGREQLFFFQIKAIAAIEVADRPDRLGHKVQALGVGVESQHTGGLVLCRPSSVRLTG